MSVRALNQRTSIGRLGLLSALVVAVLGAAWWSVEQTRASGTADAEGDELILSQSDDAQSTEDLAVDPASIEVTYEVFLARDPFETIRPPAPPEPDPTEPTTTTPTAPTSPTPPSTEDPSTPGVGTPDAKDPVTSPGGLCATGTEAVCNGTVVVLRDITAGVVTVEVNGTTYAVAPSEGFAGNLQLLRIDGGCAEFLYLNGDEADVFRLCEGGVVAK